MGGCRSGCMNQGRLIPSSAGVELICLRPKAGLIHVELRACQAVSFCPSCGSRSSRVHSRYWRTLADLPLGGIPVQISLRARKFFCVDELCTRRIFTETLPGMAQRYARRSCRASDALSWVTLALGGRAGARLARKLGCSRAERHFFMSFADRCLHLHLRHQGCLGSMSGPGRRAIAMERCCAIWSADASSICFLLAIQRQWQHGCVSTRVLKL